MANIRRKVINKWDGGIKTSPRDSNPDTTKNAQMVKGFDVYKDPKKLIPMQSWESFTTEEEKNINIRALGGYGNTVYGLGKTIINWYGSAWLYRIKVDLNPTYFTTDISLPLYLDMALLPNDFWSHVNSDGSDIRITSSDGGTAYSVSVENFDYANNTGDLWYTSSVVTTSNYFYIYYGNPNATSPSKLQNYQQSPTEVFDNGFKANFSYNFEDNNSLNGVNNSNQLQTTTAGMFKTGMTGTLSAIDTGGTQLNTPSAQNLYINGTSMGISFNFYWGSSINNIVVGELGNYWSARINTAGTVTFYCELSTGSFSFTSTGILTANAWNTVDCWYDRNGLKGYIAINGTIESQSHSGYSHDWGGTNSYIFVNTLASSNKISQIIGWRTKLSASLVATRRANLVQASFHTINSEEAKSSVFLQYDFTGLWKKEITGGNWTEVMDNGRVVRSLLVHPVNAFVDHTGTYFIVSQNPENGGFMFVAKKGGQLILDSQNTLLTVLSSDYQAIQPERAITHAVYFNGKDSYVCKLGDPSTTNEFIAGSFIQSMQAWKRYLAVAYQYIEKGFVQLWDLTTGSLATEIIETGVGKVRIVGKAEDILFSVVDNFIEDEVLSGNKPTMEIRQYVGNGSMETTHVVEVPAVVPYVDFDDTWDLSITNFKIYRNTQTLFYARIPSNEAGTTFNEGFWAVGKNEDGQLSLTLQIPTNFGMPENVFAIAQQVFFVAKDGGIYRLSDDTYNDISLYTTPKMNEGDTEIEKKLHGVEIVTEPLEAGQTISVYYKKNGDTDRTKILDMTGEGEISYETTYDMDEINLPHYKEIEFDIESTGGKAGVLEFNYKYEYLSNIV